MRENLKIKKVHKIMITLKKTEKHCWVTRPKKHCSLDGGKSIFILMTCQE